MNWRWLSWSCPTAGWEVSISSARTGCHPLVCHLAQLSPTQSLSSPPGSTNGFFLWLPQPFVCKLYLGLNKLFCNDLFIYLSCPGGDEHLGAWGLCPHQFYTPSPFAEWIFESIFTSFWTPFGDSHTVTNINSKLHLCHMPQPVRVSKCLQALLSALGSLLFGTHLPSIKPPPPFPALS